MALWPRAYRLGRLLHTSAWRFLALTATDPSLDRLYGLLQSERAPRCLDAPYPRFAIGAVEELEQSLRPGARVLEWGAGSSSLWYAARGCVVTAIEHNAVWHARVAPRLSLPSRVLLRGSEQDYARPLDSIGSFDLVVIDGVWRAGCAAFVAERVDAGDVLPGTTVLFDDTNRQEYRAALRQLASRARGHWSFTGASGVVINKMTTIFTM